MNSEHSFYCLEAEYFIFIFVGPREEEVRSCWKVDFVWPRPVLFTFVLRQAYSKHNGVAGGWNRFVYVCMCVCVYVCMCVCV